MKNKKIKKIIAMILLISMFLTINLVGSDVYAKEKYDQIYYGTSSIFTNACDHNYKITGMDMSDYHNRGPTGHATRVVTTKTCTKCGHSYDITDYVYKEPHVTDRSDWHSGKLHFTKEECIYCSYSRTSSCPCPGDPCIIIFRVVSEEE